MVELDGLAIRVVTASLDARSPDQPAVVFESGGGAPLETWDPIFSQVARFAPVVAYDRAGTGRSEWDELPPTPDRVTSRLRQLLKHIGVAPHLGTRSDGGRFLVAEQVGHLIHVEDPDLTIDEIRRLAGRPR
jgi:pimeloyl-ACP methyl ester carboxylesterase